MPDQKRPTAIQAWAAKVNWKLRVKAVCKPCWEIKYCPYGPLVEDFPLPKERDERSCRIFGHHCPVFYVAEPFTETRELRNISRTIPRPVQFRVLKRDNQICGGCGKPVLDGDIHFDHIIPWSKGGPSEEQNIRLLCGPCNQKRGADFESEYLVDSFTELIVDPIDASFVAFLLDWVQVCLEHHAAEMCWPPAELLKALTQGGDDDLGVELRMLHMMRDIDDFFENPKPAELDQRLFEALRFRWGFVDHHTYRLMDCATEYAVELDALFSAEVEFLKRLGWMIKHDGRDRRVWLRS